MAGLEGAGDDLPCQSTAETEMGYVIFLLVLLAAWGTHIVVCLKTGAWGFLIAGALVLPIAWIHGIGSWFGLW